jgi:glyoxylase-like metal-dependent hydrolase (beta-lactamase superfamily II)
LRRVRTAISAGGWLCILLSEKGDGEKAISMILRMLVVGPFGSNCYVAGSERTEEGIIIDPGANAEAIIDMVRKLGLNITLIVATHGHVDHLGALNEVKGATKAPFAMHAGEAAMLPKISKYVSSVFGVRLASLPPPDRLLHEGDIIKVGELSFRVLHTPGHSPGGISLAGQGVVFSGDTLFNYGIGRTDFPDGDYDVLMESIRTKLMTLPDNTVVFSGHGPKTTIGAERRGNPFSHDWSG